MIAEKIRVRISNFVETILYNDTQAFGFVKADESSNTNGFLNKLIPNLLEVRKERREILHSNINTALESCGEKLPERMRSFMDVMSDAIYFRDSYLDELCSSIWIRPIKSNISKFNEIIKYETYITQQDTTTCIRNMLNEYAILPQFKREKIVFRNELEMLENSFIEDREVGIDYNGKILRIVVLQIIAGYTSYDQNNYILCLDLEAEVIKSLLLHKIKKIFITKEYYGIEKVVYDNLQRIIDKQIFAKQETFEIEEDVTKCSN